MEPTASLTFSDIFRWVMAAFSGVLMVLAKLLHNRIERIELTVREKADTKTIDEMQRLMKEHRDETRTSFRDVSGTLNSILLKLGERDND